MGQFIEYCKIAFFNIKSNKVRAFLTMLGIIIGISSVVMIVSLGNGFRKSISGELNSAVGNYIDIMDMGEDIVLNKADFDVIYEKVPHVIGYSPTGAFRGTVSYNGMKEYSALLYVSNEMYDEYTDYEIIYGRSISKEDCDGYQKNIVISKGSARKIFGYENVVGKTVEVTCIGSVQDYRIVGVRDDYSDEMEGLVLTEDLSFEIPFSTALIQRGIDIEDFAWAEALVFVDDPENSTEVKEHAIAILEARHDCRGENRFMVISMKELLASIESIFLLITLLVVLVAAISLVVGGIGVMNIMLVSVTERTREIGIRKALGARTGSVLAQFLVEAASISLLGGIIGMIIGLAGAEVVCVLIAKLADMQISADFNPFFILGIAAFSTAIGIFFGIYPARKAAKLSPIEALRHR